MSEIFETDEELAYRAYWTDASGYSLLSAEQERALATRIQHGDRDALNTLVQHNLRLVVSIAKHYMNHGLPLMDLIQEGNIGLIRAAQRYDPTRNTRFSTHAHWWIRQVVRRAVMERGTAIHSPSYVAERIKKIQRITAELAVILERDPTDAEIATSANLTLKEVKQGHGWYLALHAPLSLDRAMDDDETLFLSDSIEDVRVPDEETRCTSVVLKDAIDAALRNLSPREQLVIRARFGLCDDESGHKTLKTVGDELGVSRERIRQIEVKALRLLKPHLAHLVQEVGV